MFFHSFFNVLTLQIGTSILSITCILISCLCFVVNNVSSTSTEIEHWYVGHILVCVFVTLMVITGLVMFFSAYNQSITLCYATLGLLCFTALFWAVLTVIPFINNPSATRKVCVRRRCAESFWLASLHLDPNLHNTSSTDGPKSSTKPSDYPDYTTIRNVGLESSTMPAEYSDYTTIEDVGPESTDYSDYTTIEDVGPESSTMLTDYTDYTTIEDVRPGSNTKLTDDTDYTTIEDIGSVESSTTTKPTTTATASTSTATKPADKPIITPKQNRVEMLPTVTVGTTNTIRVEAMVGPPNPREEDSDRKKRLAIKYINSNDPEQAQLEKSYKRYEETNSIIAKNIKEQENLAPNKDMPRPPLKLAGIVFFALINVFFFIFSILVVSSFARELRKFKYTDYKYHEPYNVV